MSFLNPIAFWGLLSLIIPLVIHLLSKRQKNTIYFGSNLFLEETETTSARSFQLSDLPLLLIRLLMLGGLVLAIAQLVKPDDSINKIIYIEDALVQSEDYNSILTSIPYGEEIQHFTFSKGLSNDSIKVFPSAYTLIHHLNKSADSITVLTYSLSKYFIGSQVSLNKNINWEIIPRKELVSEEKINKTPLPIEIISSAKSSKNARELKTVINSIAGYLPFEINYSKSEEWKIMIDTISKDGAENQISWNTNSSNFSFGKGIDEYVMKGELSKKAMLSTDFPLKLTQAFLVSRTLTDEDLKVFDPTSTAQIDGDQTLKAEIPTRHNSLSKYLWLLVVLLLLAERYYSLSRTSK